MPQVGQSDFFFCNTKTMVKIINWPPLTLQLLVHRFGEHPLDSFDPWTAYGPAMTIIIIALRLLSFLALPQVHILYLRARSQYLTNSGLPDPVQPGGLLDSEYFQACAHLQIEPPA